MKTLSVFGALARSASVIALSTLQSARELTNVWGDRVVLFHSHYHSDSRKMLHKFELLSSSVPSTVALCTACIDGDESIVRAAQKLGVRALPCFALRIEGCEFVLEENQFEEMAEKLIS
jgi:cytosine/adenosine deaminase-related metal-dependent hydrolase